MSFAAVLWDVLCQTPCLHSLMTSTCLCILSNYRHWLHLVHFEKVSKPWPQQIKSMTYIQSAGYFSWHHFENIHSLEWLRVKECPHSCACLIFLLLVPFGILTSITTTTGADLKIGNLIINIFVLKMVNSSYNCPINYIGHAKGLHLLSGTLFHDLVSSLEIIPTQC